jgi:hypothetical protein
VSSAGARGARRRVFVLGAAALGLLTTWPATSDAATASLSGDTAVFAAGRGEGNRLTVSLVVGSGALRFHDSGATLSAGSGCFQQAPNTVECTSPNGVRRASLVLDDLGDILAVSAPLPVEASGGHGADVLFGGPLSDSLRGEGGKDNLEGLAGDDRLRGGGVRDRMLGGGGADRLEGGGGKDQLSGGAGRDLLLAGKGIDQLNAGRDRLPDRLNCGPGIDFAFIFKRDRARGCEFKKRF